jgi:hypothetical protein
LREVVTGSRIICTVWPHGGHNGWAEERESAGTEVSKSMAITFQLPEGVEQRLREECADVDQAAKEATLIEFYRQGKVGHFELSQSLGLSRFEIDGVLKRHGVTEDLPTPEEHEAQLAGLRELLGR